MEIPSEVLRRSNLIENGVNEETGGLKEHQSPLNVGDQIGNLKEIGLVIDSDERAVEKLNQVSYFRLIKAYGVGLKEKNGKFDGSVSFDDLVALYDFDAEFRQLLISQIEKIEVALRCRLANYFCLNYGVLGYFDKDNFGDTMRYNDTLREIYLSIKYNKRSPFVKNFQKNYRGSDIPFYALVEVLSFGTVSKFYKDLKNSDKKEIAKMYGVNWPYLESWFESLAYVRNICAHYGRLYNVRLDITPKMPADLRDLGVANNRVFGVMCCMGRLLPKDDAWSRFLEEIKKLLVKFPQVDKAKIGFLEDWEALLA